MLTASHFMYLSLFSLTTIRPITVFTPRAIDFGTSCTGKDGRVHSGKIIVTATSFKIFPSVRQKTFENFQIDGRKMEGTITKTIQNDETNAVRTATIKENVRVINTIKGDTISCITDMTRQCKRNVLADKTDDQTLTWGSLINTRPNDVLFTKTIAETTPLLFEASCRHIVSGIATFENSNGRKWSINYGDGSCDNKATLTVNGKSKEITIH